MIPRTTLLHRTTIVALLALLSTAGSARTGSAQCVDYSNIMHAIGWTQVQGPVAVVVSGNYAYTAKRNYGFQMLNVSDPTAPYLLGGVSTTYATDVALSESGPYAYVADRYSIKVIDISDPIRVKIVGQLATPDGAYHLAVSGSYVYVADGDYGVRVIDVSNPLAPAFVTALDTFGSAAAIAISGSYAYVADNSDGLLVLDISDPHFPAIVGSVATPEWATGVSVLGSYAYVIDGPWVHVIDVSNPTAPVIIATINGLSARNLFPVGSRLYAIGSQGLSAVDISNPAAPVILGVTGIYNNGGDDLFVSGSYAYVAEAGSQRLEVFDVTKQFSPIFPTLQVGGTLATSGHYVYANSAGTLNVIDVSDPTSPVITGSTSVGSAGRIAAQGSYVYVCASILYVVDVSNPAAPTVVGTLATSGSDIAVSGSHVYLAFNGIRVVNVSNPRAPVLAGSAFASGTFLNIAVSGSTAYVTGDVSGHMAIFNVSNPASPTLVGTSNITGTMTFSGGYMFNVPDAYTQGGVLRIYNSGLSLVGSVPGLGTPYSKTAVSGSFAYLVTNARDVHAIDISDVTSPHDLGILTPPAGANQLVASAFNIFVTSGNTLSVLPLQCPAGQTGIDDGAALRFRLTASPNPFRSGVDLHFALERDAQVRVVILDLQGRKVRDLVTGEFPAGTHRASWEGKDDFGHSVAAGLYFARLATGEGKVQVQKLFKVR